MAKNTILVYTDLMEQLDELSMEERGIILTAMIKYQLGEELPKMDKTLKLVFIPIRQSIDRDNDAYVRKCEKNRENINKRWNTTEYDRIRSDTNHTDNDNDNENDKDNVKDKDNDKDNGSSSRSIAADAAGRRLRRQFEAEAIQIWNSQRCTQPIKNITTHRAAQISECDSPDEFLHTIRDLDQQLYLKEEAEKGKKVKFDWFIQQENYNKVLEGNYKDSYDRGGGHGSIWD